MRFETRRAVCRLAFVVLCAVPTMLFSGAAWFVHSPAYGTWRKSRWETSLSVAMDADVRVERAVRNRGNIVLYGVQVRNPEQHQLVARVRSVEIVNDGRCWNVEVNQCEVRRDALIWLTQRLHEHVLLSDRCAATIQFHACNLILAGGAPPTCLADFNCRVQENQGGREMLVDLKTPEHANDDPIRLRIVRNRQLTPPATGWELHTGLTPLPCSMVSPWMPVVAGFGADCTFAGSIWVELTRSGWNAQLAGTFLDVDLNQLVTNRFPHKLSGTARVNIENSVFHSGRLVEADGTIEAAGGVVSASLLRAAHTAFHWQQRDANDGPALVRYQKLGVKFTLDAKSLTLRGLAGAAGVVLKDNDGALLSVGQNRTVSPLALIRLLAPDSQWTVPATKETASLVRVLPLPEIVPTDTNNACAPYAPLRLRR